MFAQDTNEFFCRQLLRNWVLRRCNGGEAKLFIQGRLDNFGVLHLNFALGLLGVEALGFEQFSEHKDLVLRSKLCHIVDHLRGAVAVVCQPRISLNELVFEELHLFCMLTYDYQVAK